MGKCFCKQAGWLSLCVSSVSSCSSLKSTPGRGQERRAAQVSPVFRGAEAAMEQDAGDVSWDPFCRCACHLQSGMVAFPRPVPLLLITPWCIGSWREGEVLLLPGFIGEWRGAELCKSLTHTVPVMGTSRTGGVCLEGHTSDFWGQMAGLLLPPERTEIIWAHHCVSECTYSQRSGKSFVASQYKGKEEHGGPMERVLCAKSCW